MDKEQHRATLSTPRAASVHVVDFTDSGEEGRSTKRIKLEGKHKPTYDAFWGPVPTTRVAVPKQLTSPVRSDMLTQRVDAQASPSSWRGTSTQRASPIQKAVTTQRAVHAQPAAPYASISRVQVVAGAPQVLTSHRAVPAQPATPTQTATCPHKAAPAQPTPSVPTNVQAQKAAPARPTASSSRVAQTSRPPLASTSTPPQQVTSSSKPHGNVQHSTQSQTRSLVDLAKKLEDLLGQNKQINMAEFEFRQQCSQLESERLDRQLEIHRLEGQHEGVIRQEIAWHAERWMKEYGRRLESKSVTLEEMLQQDLVQSEFQLESLRFQNERLNRQVEVRRQYQKRDDLFQQQIALYQARLSSMADMRKEVEGMKQMMAQMLDAIKKDIRARADGKAESKRAVEGAPPQQHAAKQA